jgi:glycosyltransferase involved in cell wall biosynthesis
MNNKICVLTSVHSVTDERILLKECRSLARAGYRVTLVGPHSHDEQVSGVSIRAVPEPKNRFTRLIRTSLEICSRAISERAEIYHFHDPELIPVGLLLRLARKKVIYDIHEQTHLQILGKSWITPGFRKIISCVVDLLERLAAKRFSALISANEDIHARFISMNLNSILVRNFPLLEEFPATSDQHRFSAGVIACFGGISVERVAPQIVEAFGMLPSDCKARLILGGNSQSQELERRLTNQFGWQRVDYRGYLQREEMMEVLSKSAASIVLYDNQPNHLGVGSNRFFDSLAAGLPVITPDFPRWRKTIETYGCGITVDPSKPEEIAHAVAYLTDHPKKAADMGRRGFELARQTLNWDCEAVKLIELYASLFSKASKSGATINRTNGDVRHSQQKASTLLAAQGNFEPNAHARNVKRSKDLNLEIHGVDSADCWNESLRRAPNKTIFHSNEWLKLVTSINNVGLVRGGIYLDGELVGLFPIMLLQRSLFRLAGSPLAFSGLFSPYLGPATRDDLVVPAIEAFAAWTKQERIDYAEMALDRELDPQTWSRLKYELAKRQSVWMSIPSDKDALWRGLEKRCRGAVRKAESSGVRVQEISDGKFFENYLDMAADVYSKSHRPPPFTLAFYEGLWEMWHEKGIMKVLAAFREGQLLAAAVFLLDRAAGRAYYLDGASYLRFHELNANTLIQWVFLQELVREGFKLYDMLGADQEGIRRFKLSFGGTLRSYDYVFQSRSAASRVAREGYRFLAPAARYLKYRLGSWG